MKSDTASILVRGLSFRIRFPFPARARKKGLGVRFLDRIQRSGWYEPGDGGMSGEAVVAVVVKKVCVHLRQQEGVDQYRDKYSGDESVPARLGSIARGHKNY